jgi:hypothetical protein
VITRSALQFTAGFVRRIFERAVVVVKHAVQRAVVVF